ncbi:ribonuclease III [endosymbiont of Acanthamoeba sp. UWC8]|nr:ribonuclease III [endosymbiont of Acanthamoeba sp. UWC8]
MPADLFKVLNMQINYKFKDRQLLKLALTHPSVAKNSDTKNATYERLEFLGDSVLGLVIAEAIYKKFPDADEGELSTMHAKLVSKDIVSEIAESINLGEDLILDSGEDTNGGRENPGNLEDAMEAVIAAIYLDGGYATILSIVENLWGKYLSNKALLTEKNIKSRLQEDVQHMGLAIPIYKIVEKTGLDHSPHFKVKVIVENIGSAIGEGKSKKQAEVAAATLMLKIMEKNNV